MSAVEIIVGSMLGATEYVADALAEKFDSYDISNHIHLNADLADLNPQATWLLCTSTHGAGDLPDNIQSFSAQLQQAELAHIRYLIIGLGDSSYDTFCEAAKTLHRLMQERGAQCIQEPLFIDVLHHPIPEEEAAAWLDKKLKEEDLASAIKNAEVNP
ncbi:FMN-binding protein MioC [Lacimicrobium sp. SS2-24]|uniref:FMN-binding protein MioC n=1 Tax=Lacimicrobium sp. SS2-24 TaxID=2005569 RepID=UPI000B4BA533|nr:FMN-binding protein MioC [Lacimicrobium sp. SS2-24]